MKKKLLRFVLALCLFIPCSVLMTGCFGEDKTDATLYHLTLTVSENVKDLIPKDGTSLKAELAFGVDGNESRDDDDITALKKAGATDEDIASVGVLKNGYFPFFDNDPMYIKAPEYEGYEFLGFFYKGTNHYVYKYQLGLTEGAMHYYRWNMQDKNVELEARYIPECYTITYYYSIERGPSSKSGEMPSTSHSNPANFNYSTDKNKEASYFELSDPTEVIEGYEFKYWYYTLDGSAEKHKIEILPRTITDYMNNTIFNQDTHSYSHDLQLRAFYDIATYDVTFIVDEGVELEVRQDSNLLTIGHDPIEVEHGTVLDVWAIDGNITVDRPGYKFDGIYVNGVKRPTARENITINGNTTIQIKVVPET